MARPLVGVYSNDITKAVSTIVLPAVFTAPIRPDIIHDVHTNMNKNHRQPYAVSKFAGHQTSAESWGTGRAVARIPRVPGGGTHRAGQAAFGNMCRGGRMFAPTKTWRRWHRKSNLNLRRYATASALAASAIPALVQARGHKISAVPEVPLVLDNKTIDSVDKTSKAVKLLKEVGAYADVLKAKNSRGIRAGKGKARNRRYTQRLGPLIIYNQKGTLTRAFRNLPGVELVHVSRLNLLRLAPGGHLGRFIIWTKDAFEKLDTVFGTYKHVALEKSGYHLPRPHLTSNDVTGIINSTAIQSALRAKIPRTKVVRHRRNPLKNINFATRLNPYAKVQRRAAIITQERQLKAKAKLLEDKRKGVKPAPKTTATKAKKVVVPKAASKKYVATLLSK